MPANQGPTIFTETAGVGNAAVIAYGINGSDGITASSDSGYGVHGESVEGTGVDGRSVRSPGVFGESDTSMGVVGRSNLAGVQGDPSSEGGVGVYGENLEFNGVGVWGQANTGVGVRAMGGNMGVDARRLDSHGHWLFHNSVRLATRYYAGDFQGAVYISGNLIAPSKYFIIDHPLDPDNKYLYHASVESSDLKNIYDGMAILDANGEAVIDLPAWFEILNTNFRYQLTPIGAPGPNLYIAEEISNARFKISGGAPMMNVSWQLTGIRDDAWAKAHPIEVEGEKPVEERGYYLHPEFQGAPKEKSIEWARYPQQAQQKP
jgi:hypothetical protein